MAVKKLDPPAQLEIIARIARGDRYEDIAKDKDVSIGTITAVKQKNEKALTLIKERMIEHKLSKVSKIRDKSLDLIENKLDKAAAADKQRENVLYQARNKQITWEEAEIALKTIYDASLADLNAISKEAFNQSRVEQTVAQGALEPVQAEANLKELMLHLESGNEIELQRIVLKAKE